MTHKLRVFDTSRRLALLGATLAGLTAVVLVGHPSGDVVGWLAGDVSAVVLVAVKGQPSCCDAVFKRATHATRATKVSR